MASKHKQGINRIKRIFHNSPGNSEPSTSLTQNVGAPPVPVTNPHATPAHLELLAALFSNTLPNAASHDNTTSLPTAFISPPPPVIKQSAKRKRWAQLSTLSDILGKASDSFGPLKEATAAQNREGYQKLRDEFNVVFHDLVEFFGSPTPSVMTPSIVNLAQRIERELEIIRQKQLETGGIGSYLNASTDADEILEHYRRIQALLQQITMNGTLKTLQIVDEQAADNRIKSLPNSEAAKYNSAESYSLRDGCTADTRLDVLDELCKWARDDKSQRIYWLNGMAGTGKTTIAYSLCERLESSSQLAASFFCSRQLPECRSVNRIIPTISHQLSHFSHPFRSAISQLLQEKPGVHNQLLEPQLKTLIVGPLNKVKDTLPVDLVIVIDALDECDDSDGVGWVLNALLLHAKNIPIKFFVASRPDAKILDHMRGQHGENVTTELRLHELGRPTVQQDIKTYLNAKLRPHIKLSTANLNTLVERSGVLFIYASTVVRYLECDNFSRAEDRLEEILRASKRLSNDSVKGINDLYTVILKTALNNPNMTSWDKAETKLVLDTVICAKEPLSIDVMAGLLRLSTRKVQAALRPLFSVLHLSDMTGHTITTLHKSFPDYLLDKNRSGVFHCNAKKHHSHLAQLCFENIKLVNPPFNICNLKSSYKFDKHVSDLPARIEKAISKQLLYACRYWVAHCMSAEGSEDLVIMLREFMSERFLLWMEVMNLSGRIQEGTSMLDVAQKWSLKPKYLDDGIRRFLRDMWLFTDSFSSTEAGRSTPHIYVSTLAFWPEHTPISDLYRPRQKSLITERSTALRLRPRKFAPLARPDPGGSILCVSYSPDGAYIVSGTFDGVILIWSARTGFPIRLPLRGHTGPVNSVTYSPDGAYIISGSWDKTTRIWNAHTGQQVGQPLQGPYGSVFSTVCSPDGAYIVSGSWDNTISIWDARAGQPVGQALQGHTGPVNSVAYSPDGACIVSGSFDKTLRIWDAYTGQPIGQSLEGHTSTVWSVAYSPDGAYIVSGSSDNTIRIWSAHTGQPIGQPLQGHANSVTSVAYSPDSAYIVSGSSDETIRVWNMNLILPMSDGSQIDNGRPQFVHESLSPLSKARIPCNLNCRISCPHMAWTLNDDGWVVFNGNRLIWVPLNLHDVLLPPQNTALMTKRGFLHLDLDRNKLGKHWDKCFQL